MAHRFWLLPLVLLLGGCLDPSTPAATAGRTTEPTAPAPLADAQTGSIAGLVLDEEARPLAAAGVAIPQLTLEASTDAEGRFTFNTLDTGSYQVFATKPGYEQTKRMVDVVPGDVTKVELGLKALIINRAWVDVQTKVQGVNGGNYLQPVPNDVQMWSSTWVVKDDPQILEDLIIEARWKPTTALADGIRLWSGVTTYNSGKDLCVGSGHNPYKCRVAPERLAVDWACNPADTNTCRGGYMIRPGGSSSTSSLVGLWPQESVTLYLSHFFRQPAPQDYSAAPA